MVEWISDWAGGIIVAVIIGTVIEILLPEGNSKKYIKMVIGIYVLFTIVSPIITKFTGESIQVSDILELDTYIEEVEQASKTQNIIKNNNQDNIMNIYLSGMKDDIRAKVETKGYVVDKIDVGIADDETYAIKYITLNVSKKMDEREVEEKDDKNIIDNNIDIVEKIEEVEKIEINVESEKESKEEENKNYELSYSKKEELKEYLSSVYEVDTNNITIN